MKYQLEVSREELLMLQEAVKAWKNETPVQYDWQIKLIEKVENKLLAGYKKPIMQKAAFDRAVEHERTKWPDKDLGRKLASAESARLEFYYDIQEQSAC